MNRIAIQKNRFIWASGIKQDPLFDKNVRKAGLVHMVRSTGLEPVRQRHTHLKRACLPVPARPLIFVQDKTTLPRALDYYSIGFSTCQPLFSFYTVRQHPLLHTPAIFSKTDARAPILWYTILLKSVPSAVRGYRRTADGPSFEGNRP